MMRWFLGTAVGLLAIGPVPTGHADEKTAWQEADLKKLDGRWATVREEKVDGGKVRRRRVDLEFAGGNLTVSTFDEKDAQTWKGPPLKVEGVERGEGLGSVAILKLDRAAVYYDLVGEKLVVVGGIARRPFEGFKLSGAYTRADRPK